MHHIRVHLGILKFKVPDLVGQLHIDYITFPSSPYWWWLKEDHKMCITFEDPLISLPHCIPQPHSNPTSLQHAGRLWRQSGSEAPSCHFKATKTYLPSPVVPSQSEPSNLQALLTMHSKLANNPSHPLQPPNPAWLSQPFLPQWWPRTSVALKQAFPSVIWHNRQHAQHIHHKDWPFHSCGPLHAWRKVPIEYWEHIECAPSMTWPPKVL